MDGLNGRFATLSGQPLTRETYCCEVTNEEIDALGPNPTWEDWKPLLMSKGIPPMRLNDGADFRMDETETGATLEFP